MPVQNVECQIARLQIGRFLKGEILPKDMMAQLEAHLGRCQECRAELAGRKAELHALANGSAAVGAPEPSRRERTEPQPAAARPNQQKAAPRKAAVATPPAAAQPFPWKLLVYSLSLAGVLAAMSFLAKDPTALFGAKAADAAEASPASGAQQGPEGRVAARQPEQPFPTIYVPSMDEPIDRDELAAPPQESPSADAAAAPSPEPVEPPAQTSEQASAPASQPARPRAQAPAKPRPLEVRPAEARRPTARPARRRPAADRPAEPRGTLRLYDEQGRPIQP
ncbi:MAG: hypothetical protein N2109_07845 [Fimbriimonadales bacterium]|nr:hypothetical protein [Fimbriimonadales bacterium]